MKNAMTRRFGGFTLIELLVVVLIIGILAAIAVPQYEQAVEKARVTEALLVGKNLKNAEELYRMENGTYTDSFEKLGTDLPGGYVLSADGKQISSRKENQIFFISLLTDYDRVLVLYSKQGRVLLSFSFDLNTRAPTRHCTSYSDTNYEGDKICKGLGTTGTWSEHCQGTCHTWELL